MDLGIGARIELSRVQSRVRVMEMLLSAAEEKSLLFEGKERAVMGRVWWVRVPRGRLAGFSAVFGAAPGGAPGVGRVGLLLLDEGAGGGVVERL